MCFVLYLACGVPVPTILWDEAARKLNTHDLSEHEADVAMHFTKRFTKYVGSDQCCGCGFRNVKIQDEVWPEEDFIGSQHYTGDEEQPNHEQLHKLVTSLLGQAASVQVYGCFDGEFTEPVESRASINVNRLLDVDFYFRERGFYEVTA